MVKCSEGQSNAQTGCTGKLPAKEFDYDAAAYMNAQMPLAMLEDAAENMTLPANLRLAVAEMAWVRGVALGDDAAVKRMAKLLPDAVRKTAGDSDGYPATLAMLRAPGLRPFLEQGVPRSASFSELDHYRDNWWCAKWADEATVSGMNGTTYTGLKMPSLGFLTAAERQQAAAEAAKLNALPQGLVWVGQRAIAYVKAHPEDKSNAETLALLVQGTRYGCNYNYDNKPTPQTAVSKEAFEMLHRMYPKSEWTAKTKYYY
jgi:hypothetical protein